MIERLKKAIVATICFTMILSNVLPVFGTNIFSNIVQAVEVEYTTSNSTKVFFSNEGITAEGKYSGYTITDNTIEISSSGVYVFSGSCSDGSIVVKKSISGVVLVLDNLSLTSTTTSPITIKSSADVTIHLKETSTLNDSEIDDTLDTYEGAAIKFKSASKLTFCGDGVLNVNGNSKNGIKGGATSQLTINSGIFNVTAQNNAIAADGDIVINGGVFDINSQNDGIKAVPDSTDTESDGSITINNGTFDIDAQGDGIQAETLLTINNGVFNIKTENGYNSSTFDADTMSCKGIKASGDREDIENEIIINGGTFNINAADDAIHSDSHVTLIGGTYYIYTGDDGVHGDTSLTLGTENGYERDPDVYVYASYEGLEAGTIYGYSGRYWIVASDDGINAAGGSDSSGTEPGGGGFNPGGRPGQGGPGQGGPGQGGSTSTSNYGMYFYGGDYYVNCTGDGIDSNGNMYYYGGNFTVLSQGRGGDNSPYDCDGSWIINGATIFGAGTNPMNETPANGSQTYKTSTTSYNANTILNLTSGSSILYSEKLPRQINYAIYSAPNLSNATFTTATSVNSCKSNSWAHKWNDGIENDGIITYTCSDCGDIERQTVVKAQEVSCDGHLEEQEVEPYTITFVTDNGVTIDVYYTQDYTTVDEENVATAYARNATTGEIASDGSGQVNFRVNVPDGYNITSVTANENYNKLNAQGDNIYRLTKVTGDVVVTVTTEQGEIEPYIVTFATSDGVTIDVYYTQDYTTPDETNVSEAYARSGSSGELDISGDGQVNFKINVVDGYEITGVSASGDYKNLKQQEDNIYRLTKVTGTVTITVETAKTDISDFLKGDLDRNGVVDANDASIALEIFKAENATDEDILIGDMDANALIDANDASLILEVYKTNL